MMDTTTPPGFRQAAILLMCLDKETTAKILGHLGPKDVQALGTAMANLSNVTQEEKDQVLQSFLDAYSGQTGLGIDKEAQIQQLFHEALGQDKAKTILEKLI